jgi:hypothetical protein
MTTDMSDADAARFDRHHAALEALRARDGGDALLEAAERMVKITAETFWSAAEPVLDGAPEIIGRALGAFLAATLEREFGKYLR